MLTVTTLNYSNSICKAIKPYMSIIKYVYLIQKSNYGQFPMYNQRKFNTYSSF